MTSEDIKHQLIRWPAWPLISSLSHFSTLSLINLMVSVDVKHHERLKKPDPLIPFFSLSLINLMVSVDVKHHER